MMETTTICSKCKESAGLLNSVSTQTDDGDWEENATMESVAGKTEAENEQNCASSDQTDKQDIVYLEDIDITEKNQSKVARNSAEVVDFAVYQNVSDEAFELDPQMELGTVAELCHESDQIVVLTRSFECSTDPKSRWKRAGNATKAANRFNLTKKQRSLEIDEKEDLFSESEESTAFGGFRRIVISNGRLAIGRQDSEIFGNESSQYNVAEEKHDNPTTKDELSNSGKDVLEESKETDLAAASEIVADKDNDDFKEKLRRASSVLGPNKRCLQLREQEDHVDPGLDVKLFENDDNAFNVVVVTRCFESGPLSESEKLARERWNRVKNVTKISKAINRFRLSNRHREDGNDDGRLCEDDENGFGPFVGSGYRRMSMKTIEEVANLARRKSRFRRIRSTLR